MSGGGPSDASLPAAKDVLFFFLIFVGFLVFWFFGFLVVVEGFFSIFKIISFIFLFRLFELLIITKKL